MNLQNIDRIERTQPIYKKMKLPPKHASAVPFTKSNKLNDTQLLKKAHIFLEKIKKSDDLIQNLIFLQKILKNLRKKRIKTFNIFCEQFPYDYFYNLISNGPIPEICNVSLKIFSYCSNSNTFPHNIFAKSSIVNFFLSLYPQIPIKYHKCLFSIFNNIIMVHPEVRDYLLSNGILNFFIPKSAKSVEFCATCISTEPDIEKGYANTINVFLILACKPPTKLRILYPVLDIFKRRKNRSCALIYNPNVIDPALVNFILEDLPQMGISQLVIPILKIASFVNLNDDRYISLVMNFLGKAPDTRVARQCMKILQNNYERWRSYNEIIDFILKILNENAGSIPFYIEQSLVQIMMLYININPNMNLSAIDHAICFVEDKVIGTNCLAFIYQSLVTIFQSPNSNENKTQAKNLINSKIEKIEMISLGDEEYPDESHDLADSIFKLIAANQ